MPQHVMQPDVWRPAGNRPLVASLKLLVADAILACNEHHRRGHDGIEIQSRDRRPDGIADGESRSPGRILHRIDRIPPRMNALYSPGDLLRHRGCSLDRRAAQSVVNVWSLETFAGAGFPKKPAVPMSRR